MFPSGKSKQREWFLLFVLLMLALSIHSCNRNSEYPGFSRSPSGIHYRLNSLGEVHNSPVPGDYITVDLRYSTISDSVFFNARRKFRLEKPSYRGSVEECFAMMSVGDEADFIIDAYDFFTITLGSKLPQFFDESAPVKISANLLDIQNEEEYINEEEDFLVWIEDLNEYEQTKIRQFIQEKQIMAKPDSLGIYFVTLDKGTGKAIEAGDTVEIHYEGKFLNGEFFDSTRKRDEIFQFVYSQQWQVLEGLERAIGMMHEGEQALVILPSDLAFGKQGSSTGIIPPYTSLVFEVEVLSVK